MLKFDHIAFEVVGLILFPKSRVSSVAKYLGLSRQYVNRLMNGKAPIPPSLWLDLSRLTEERIRNLYRLQERLSKFRKSVTSEESPGPHCVTFDGRSFASLASAMFGDKWTGCMAYRLDMSPEYMRKLAKGKRPINQHLLLKIERVVRAQMVDMEYLSLELRRFETLEEIVCDWPVITPSEEAGDETLGSSVIRHALH